MNLRCLYCQTPFTLSRNEMLSALVMMKDKNMNHYDAHCPRCRRANSISRQRMELFYPHWQEAAKNLPPPQPSASTPTGMPASASLKTEPLPKALLKSKLKTSARKTENAATKAKPAASKRQRASKPASAKKVTPAKPAPRGVKKTTKKGKK